MSRIILACLALAAVLTAGESLPPHQGTVVLAERTFADVWILAESTDGVVHTLDSKRDSPPTTLQRGRYVRVDYALPKEVNYLRGMAKAEAGKWAEAAADFLASAKKPDTWYTRENALVRAAEALVQAGKPDEAIKAIDELLQLNPKCVQQARLTYLRAQSLQAKGDAAGAIKAYSELAKKADVESLALGALGLGEAFTAEGKPDEAAKALAGAFAKLDATKDSELLGQVGVALASSQQAAGQTGPAVATLRRLAYGAADGATRARAQLAWAKILAATDATIIEAFDHAVLAMTARDAGPVADQASQLARQLSARIDKLPESQLSSALKAEYRRYLSR